MSEKNITKYIKKLTKEADSLKKETDLDKLAFTLGQVAVIHFYDKDAYFENYLLDVAVECIQKLGLKSETVDYKFHIAGYVLLNPEEAKAALPCYDKVLEGVYAALDTFYDGDAEKRAKAAVGIARRYELQKTNTIVTGLDSLWEL